MGDVFIQGAGWVTPLGTGLEEVWRAVQAGERAPVREIEGPAGRRSYRAAPAPAGAVDTVARQPRLRRSSAISLYAVAAALDALRDAGLGPTAPAECALVSAVCDGSVIYTRKFYDQVVREGAGSPLLFPETVYNAPGSHIAAVLGLDGITYTLAGDASAGLAALRMGAELIAAGQARHCLVVGAEEADWILCEAYHEWRLCGSGTGGTGVPVADGAAAVLLGSEGGVRLEAVSAGVPFFRQSEAAASMAAAIEEMRGAEPGLIVSSANGTFADRAERAALGQRWPKARVIEPKAALGEAFGASALMQVICGVCAVRAGEAAQVLAPVAGLTHQCAAALLCAAGVAGLTGFIG